MRQKKSTQRKNQRKTKNPSRRKLTPEEKKELGGKLDLFSKKGVYPYDFTDNIKKIDETNLPPKDEFFSKLNDENITDEDFEHAKKVWKTFNCKNMGDYHDLYLKTDVLLQLLMFLRNSEKFALKTD